MIGKNTEVLVLNVSNWGKAPFYCELSDRAVSQCLWRLSAGLPQSKNTAVQKHEFVL